MGATVLFIEDRPGRFLSLEYARSGSVPYIFSVNQNGIRRWVTPLSGDQVWRCSQQFDHWKDRVEMTHGLGQAETVGICSDTAFYNIRAQKAVC